MLAWMIQTMFLSIVFIFLVHHLIHFFTTTLTVPKLKDLVNKPTLQYEHMYKIINQERENDLSIYKNLDTNTVSNTNDYTLIDLLPSSPPPNVEMKNELKNFLKSQLSG